MSSDKLWYKDAVIYQTHVKSFRDSNADGYGDFRGLTEKLDYIQQLGADTIWLLPFYPSPLKDDGYDISSYESIHPQYGTVEDFHTFLDKSHERGMRVIAELVVNHTSDQHPWFQRARRARPGSAYRDFYVWSDSDQKYSGRRIRAELDAHYPDRMLLAEANQWPEDTKDYFGAGDECHMAFHFPLMPRMYMAIAREDRFPITDILRQTPDIPSNCQWAIFLRNHDELTLEMVTETERDYLWHFYATHRRLRINLGIRRRLATLLNGERRRIELMTSFLLSLPGT